MARRAVASLAVLASLLLPAYGASAPRSLVSRALAEGPKSTKGGVFPSVTEATADEAKKTVEALKAAVESKDEKKIVAAVEPAMVEKRHADFVPELKKLAVDKRDAVGEAAARALGSQGDKTVATILMKVVAADTRENGYLMDGWRKAAAVEALGRLGVAGAYDAVQKFARGVTTDTECRARYAPVLARACTRYYGLTKEKRAVTWLIDQVDKPELQGGITGTTPPAEYWKGRQEVWAEIRFEVHWALKEITGKEFESGNRWKNWFDSEGKKAGMK
jgi:hypothetical protein